ncbi:Hpt domain-containing protein [Xenophilus azovorans]|uniref:hybrid sensor histidine kinase/response regulator n=1 Tax=Xenophilus azovorans TaxID=151755 RepID=UPI00056F84EF|nr:Hpt domain-containing protein [Xenophilus azovorans]
MSNRPSANAPVAGNAPASEDLGPLAWVIGEVQKSIETAGKSLRRQAREGASEQDSGPLRMARQQLHQAVGALQMVGHAAPAMVLGAMEFAVQSFVLEPARCTDAAVQKVEQAGFAVGDFLAAVLAGKAVSAVALFPQYREVLELVGNERVHPANLWTYPWVWAEVPKPTGFRTMIYDPAVRTQLDRDVLKVVKGGDEAAARRLSVVCAGLGRGAAQPRVASFWMLAGGFFEALSLSLLPPDIYVKRAASRVLLQYTTLARGDTTVSDRLGQDLLFFCAQAVPTPRDEAPLLRAVRVGWGVSNHEQVDYATVQFGRFDPNVLAQARKRIETAKEMWSALSGGDLSRLRQVADTFAQLGESLLKVHPASAPMVQALHNAVDASLRSGRAPSTELAMEVATSVLYLEAAFEDLDPQDRQLTARTVQLAGRIERAREGGRPEPLEPWMEELYRRVSDRQTMGTVVDELRAHLSELEKSLDQFFRRPTEMGLLRTVPNQLLQMRGVFSVLGLEQAARTVQRMRDNVDHLMAGGSAAGGQHVESLGNNLGALGFLIDMLGYQPALAKRLFVFDDEAGELKPLMGRQVDASAPIHGIGADLVAAPSGTVVQADTVLSVDEVDAQIAARLAALAVPKPGASAAPALEEFSRAAESWTAKITGPAPLEVLPDTEVTELEEDDLQNIFLEEATEVIQGGQAAIGNLRDSATDMGELTVLRRAFHTLKGSSRMVGLMEFGEAAWAFEQVLNTWLADQRPATPALLDGTAAALGQFSQWVEAIASGQPHAWQAAPMRAAAEALANGDEVPAPAAPALPDAEALAVAARQIAAEPPVVEPPAVDRADAPTDLAPLHELPPLDLDFDIEPLPGEREPAAATEGTPPDTDWGHDDFAVTDILPSRKGPAAPAAPAALAGGEDIDFLAAAPVPVPSADAPLDFELPLEPAAEAADEAVHDAPPPAEQPGVSAEAEEDAAVPAQPEPAQAEAEPAEPAPAEDLAIAEAEAAEEQVKVIGPLRIGIPLYNVYLNEADEWSRQLAIDVGEWAAQPGQPIGESSIGLAHSLAGSSATVGFHGLSNMARLVETALDHLHTMGRGTEAQGQVLVAAAEEVRRLLHQFAAGFLKEPQASVLDDLRELASSPLSAAPAAETAEAPAPVLAPAAPATLAQAIAAPAELDEDGDDTIDLADAVDPDLFPVFEEEATELLPRLGASLRAWSHHPDDGQHRAAALRALHTLKGSARLAGAMRLGERAHRMESAIEGIAVDAGERAAIEALLGRFDILQNTFDRLRAADSAGQAELVQRAAAAVAAAPAVPAIVVEKAEAAEPAAAASAPARPLPRPAQPVALPARAGSGQTVRIRAQLLDRLVAQAGEVIITRSRLEAELAQLRSSLGDLTGNLDRLRQQLRDIEVQAESQMQSRLAQAKDTQQSFDPLEFDRFTRVQELTRMMAESVNDVATVQRTLQKAVQATEDDLSAQARQTRELQRGLLRTRMVEFEGLSDRLYRVVRQASKDTGKQVRLDITGGTIEMDRGVLDRMTPAFEHLLRNCVAHGIEDAAARERAGKEPAGLITIDLRQEGNDVSVGFRDDGAGLPRERILARARAQGLVAAGQEPSDEEVAELIFRPGFSTAAEVSELAGRGIGMDVVRSEVAALGGRIETRSAEGKGTEFKLVLPLTTAVTHVVMLRAGEVSVGVPANLVELVQRAGADDLARAYASGHHVFGGEEVPFFWAGALLQSSARSERPAGRTNTIVVVRSAAQRVALHVDEVLGNQEVVVKNLGPQLVRVPGLAGISVLASGAVALIYNPVALAALHGDAARQLQAGALVPRPAAAETVAPTAAADQPQGPAAALALPAHAEVPLVLVVDDSITVRRVTQRLLQREGYRVTLAADGLQALERLQQERPAVVLSDIEMPRMDGFDLARNIRADEKLAGLPIVMITSRIAEKHREHAKQLGVDHYLGKPYSEEELLRLVRLFAVAQPAEVA